MIRPALRVRGRAAIERSDPKIFATAAPNGTCSKLVGIAQRLFPHSRTSQALALSGASFAAFPVREC